jgi:HK97 family phage major capsid protein
MKGKELRLAQKKLEEARAKMQELETRSEELANDIEAAETNEELDAVEEASEALDAEKAEAEKAVSDLEAEVDKLERELAEIEEKQPETEDPAEEKREAVAPQKETRTMMKRWKEMSYEERSAVVRDDHVQTFLGEVRAAITEKRAISNVGYLIPDVMMGILRMQIDDYSALIGVINKENLPGTGRLITENNLPEAVWTEACANINELDLTFGKVEFDGYKVGGFIKICNASLEDADIDLAGLIIDKLSTAIAYALDKAILYGTGTKMPVGIVTALAAVSDTPHINTIDDAITGKAFIDKLIEYAALADSKYGRGSYFWVMNHKTYMYIKRQMLNTDANGLYVAGDNLPVVGGRVIELGFMPDNVIVGGIGRLYKLVERKGVQFDTTDQRFWTEDQTAFKATARYDGKLLDTDAFSVIGINDKVPSASDVTFAGDSANL